MFLEMEETVFGQKGGAGGGVRGGCNVDLSLSQSCQSLEVRNVVQIDTPPDFKKSYLINYDDGMMNVCRQGFVETAPEDPGAIPL